MIGITCMGPDAAAALANIERAEQLGIPAAWLTAGGLASDAMGVFSAAAVKTSRIMLGTCIIQTWPRHPLTLAVQAATIASFAPGRFRLGVGPSHREQLANAYGIDYRQPLAHTRDYVHILKAALQQGEVDVDGPRYRVHAKTPKPAAVPVMISALRTKSFALAGELADGAITWVCPIEYVTREALPALQRSAEAAGRPAPPIVFHAPVCITTDRADARAAATAGLAAYPNLANYNAMFRAAGLDSSNGWSDEMVDGVVMHGDEAAVEAKLRGLFAAGVGEVIAMPIAAPSDSIGSIERAWETIAKASRA
jgi:F420-dependent oxidoreductase-like protein